VFFKQLVGRLPACFVREFGKDVSEYVILRDPNHNEFEVQVVKKVNEIYFGDGWHSLKDAYDIKFGAWVSVCYISPVLFTMRVLSRWCFEISYPYYDPPLRHLLARSDSRSGIGSSVMNFCAAGSARQKSLIRSYVKDLTLYDIHSGVLVRICFWIFIIMKICVLVFFDMFSLIVSKIVLAGFALARIW
jgi:hypothetical protein